MDNAATYVLVSDFADQASLEQLAADPATAAAAKAIEEGSAQFGQIVGPVSASLV